MPMAVPMRMPSSPSAVRMPMMPSCRKHAHQVHRQPDRTDRQELAGVDLGRVDEALDRFKDDKDRDQAEEDPVREPGEGLDARVAGEGKRGSDRLPCTRAEEKTDP